MSIHLKRSSRRLILLGLTSLLALAASACGSSDSSSSSSVRSTNLTYEYSENGCTTGRQNFSTASAFCNGLLNEPLNNYCAYTFRRAAYNQQCAGVN